MRVRLQVFGLQQARLARAQRVPQQVQSARAAQDSLLPMEQVPPWWARQQREPVPWVPAQRALGPSRGCCEAGQRR